MGKDKTLRIWLNVGESSGDVYGEQLIAELLSKNPDCKIYGMGGARMRAAGLISIENAEELSVMGITEAIGHLPRIIKLLKRLKKSLQNICPDVVVVIDCPDFHFRLVRIAASFQIPVIYYVAPQVWAWRKGRVHFLRQFVKRLLCILPFEEHFFAKHKVRAEYVGHPLLDEIDFATLDNLPPQPNIIGILPGSRKHEFETLLPIFAKAAKIIFHRFPNTRFRLILAPLVDENFARQIWHDEVPLTIFSSAERHKGIRECAFAMASSGTVTLECALLGTPTIVAYRLSRLTYFLGRLLVDISYISLPNLVLDELVFPEFLQQHVNSSEIAACGLDWLENPIKLQTIRQKLGGLQKLFGKKSAVANVAEIILQEAVKKKGKKNA